MPWRCFLPCDRNPQDVPEELVLGEHTAQLLIKAKGKKKRKLNETGKLKLNVTIIYTATGGDPSTQSQKVKLIKR